MTYEQISENTYKISGKIIAVKPDSLNNLTEVQIEEALLEIIAEIDERKTGE